MEDTWACFKPKKKEPTDRRDDGGGLLSLEGSCALERRDTSSSERNVYKAGCHTGRLLGIKWDLEEIFCLGLLFLWTRNKVIAEYEVTVWEVQKQRRQAAELTMDWSFQGTWEKDDKGKRHLRMKSRQAMAGKEARRVSWWDKEKNVGMKGIKIMWSQGQSE